MPSAIRRPGGDATSTLEKDTIDELSIEDSGLERASEQELPRFLGIPSAKEAGNLVESKSKSRVDDEVVAKLHEFDGILLGLGLATQRHLDAGTENELRTGDHSKINIAGGDDSKMLSRLGNHSQIEVRAGEYPDANDAVNHCKDQSRLGEYSQISPHGTEPSETLRPRFSDVAMFIHHSLRWQRLVARQKVIEVPQIEGRQGRTQPHNVRGTGQHWLKEGVDEKSPEVQGSRLEKLVRLKWICACGQIFEEVMHEFVPGAVQGLASELSTPECSNIGLSSISSSESSSSQTAASSFGSSARSRHTYQGSDDLAIDIDGSVDEESSQEPPRVQKFILLCLASKGTESLEQADMSSAKTDRCMYTELHRCYFTPMRKFLRLLTLRTLEKIEFTRFQLYNDANVAIEAGDVGSLPPDSVRDYEYERKHPYRPLIPLTALKHWTENPSHVRSKPLHLRRVPTKISGKLHWADDDAGEVEGWGLRFKEMISWRAVWVSEFFIASFATVFAIIWCSRRDGDLQDGFTVAGVVLAYGTIFLGLVQGFAQYLERHP